MKKLCQCKQDTLRALVLGTATGAAEYEDEDDLDDFAYEQLNAIVKLLESDCVCENKEEVLEDPSTWPTVTIDQETNTVSSKGKVNVVIQTKMFDLKEEKQSQSPCEPLTDRAELSQCEHKFNEGEVRTLYNQGTNDELLSLTTLYMCTQCGLVTCVNPNYK